MSVNAVLCPEFPIIAAVGSHHRSREFARPTVFPTRAISHPRHGRRYQEFPVSILRRQPGTVLIVACPARRSSGLFHMVLFAPGEVKRRTRGIAHWGRSSLWSSGARSDCEPLNGAVDIRVVLDHAFIEIGRGQGPRRRTSGWSCGANASSDPSRSARAVTREHLAQESIDHFVPHFAALAATGKRTAHVMATDLPRRYMSRLGSLPDAIGIADEFTLSTLSRRGQYRLCGIRPVIF